MSQAKPEEPKQLTNKELKELKKKEKAAKRAAQKEALGISAEKQQSMAQEKIEKAKKPDTASHLKKQLDSTVIKDDSKKIPLMFSHLETREQRNALLPQISSIVHPEILTLTLKYLTYKIVGLTARLVAMLRAFQVVIGDYRTPADTSLLRHLTGHLGNQIEYLTTARPLSISMGNAIRWLKQEISHIPIDVNEEEAKALLVEKIEDFIRDKVELSDKVIVENAKKHITDGAVIITYGHSQVLQDLFIHCAVEENKKFTLIVVDSRPLFEGKRLLNALTDTYAPGQELPIAKTHIDVFYTLISSLTLVQVEGALCVFLGAHAMLLNGRLYSRVGTAMIAMMAHSRNVPVLTCCELIKFSDRVQLDSVTTNELADPEDLVHNIDTQEPPQKKTFALEQFLKSANEKAKAEQKPQQKSKKDAKKDAAAPVVDEKDPLKDWRLMNKVTVLNIMYDLTPPEYIQKVITELGALPPSSVPVILREYKNT